MGDFNGDGFYNMTSVCKVCVFVFLFEVENEFNLWSLTKMAASPVTLHSAWLSLLDLRNNYHFDNL